MKYCLVAGDGEAQVVVGEGSNKDEIFNYGRWCSIDCFGISVPCKFHVCRREPSLSGERRIVIETWEKGVKV